MRKIWIGLLGLAVMASAIAGSAAERKHATRDFMRKKLSYTVGIVEGLTLEKYGLVITNSMSLRNMNLTNAFLALKNPDYIQDMTNFQARVDGLISAAKDKNLDQAKSAYNEVISSCIACHQSFRRDQALRDK